MCVRRASSFILIKEFLIANMLLLSQNLIVDYVGIIRGASILKEIMRNRKHF